MPRTIYLYLLILCGIWSEGIIGAFADENTRESLSHLVRQKRVVSDVTGEDVPVRIDDHPYIVNIKRFNRIFCVGSILSHRVVITAAECGRFSTVEYKVMSSSRRTFDGSFHNITEIKVYSGNHPNRLADGIALFTLDPPIVYSRYSYGIGLHVEPVLPGILGVVSGWGCAKENGNIHGTKFSCHLRSIEVPIMKHRDCINRYRQHYPITDKDICTFHPERRSGHTDAGAPLVIDNKLVGIFLRRGPIQKAFDTGYPDVFAFLQDISYSRWIRANI